MTTLSFDRNRALAIFGKIAKDYIPNFGNQDVDAILADSDIAIHECVTFLEGCIQFYKHQATLSPQIHQSRTRESRTHMNTMITRPPRTGRASVTETSSFQLPQRPNRSSQQLPAQHTETCSRPAATKKRTTAKRQAMVSSLEPHPKRRARAPPTAALSHIPEFMAGIENEVIAITETLQKVSVSKKLANVPPDVFSVASGNLEDASVISVHVKERNLRYVTDTMIFCQKFALQSEANVGILRISTAIWKLMYIDSYEIVSKYV